MLFRKKVAAVLSGVLAGLAAGITGVAATETEEQLMQFMDCFDSMPIIGSLSDSCWGAQMVGPRDQDNGLEDREMKSYTYWDGGIIKDDDTGTYYMFASRWDQIKKP